MKMSLSFFKILGIATFSYLSFMQVIFAKEYTFYDLANSADAIRAKEFLLQHPPKMTAGILPVAVDQEGNCLLILSREAKGNEKGKYSDFGGKGEPGESLEDAMKRESEEESIKIFSKQIIEKLLSKNRGVLLCIKNNSGWPSIHYLPIFKWGGKKYQALKQFGKYRSRLDKTDAGNVHFLEKDNIIAVDMKELKTALRDREMNGKINDKEYDNIIVLDRLIHNGRGQVRRIELREFFAVDFVGHPFYDCALDALRKVALSVNLQINSNHS